MAGFDGLEEFDDYDDEVDYVAKADECGDLTSPPEGVLDTEGDWWTSSPRTSSFWTSSFSAIHFFGHPAFFHPALRNSIFFKLPDFGG